ncbi:MAG TPA: HNH endonuclease [Vicinamibacteria bacterium]|jgi:5-methylcytosine-specific restriction endonuclease McrA
MESEIFAALQNVSDDELLRRLAELVSHSQCVEAELVAHIGEVDERRLYAGQACPSMFAYCTQRLHLSEAEAYLRITVARAARTHGVLLEMLRDGRLHLRGIVMLAPLLTQENRDSLLRRATHLSKREMEGLVAELSPRPDVASGIRRLAETRDVRSADSAQAEIGRGSLDELCPDRVGDSRAQTASGASNQAALSQATPSAAPSLALGAPRVSTPADSRTSPARSDPEALSPGRYKVQFTASAQLKDKIERLTALMRSEIPDGDLALVIEQAVSEKLQRLEARRFAKTNAPRRTLAESETSPISRRVPAAVRRAVHKRDAGRCTYVDAKGRRCGERRRLEFHHRHPYAMGGDHSPGNVSLLCAAHNRLMAEHDYGRAAILRNLPSAEVHRRAPGTA